MLYVKKLIKNFVFNLQNILDIKKNVMIFELQNNLYIYEIYTTYMNFVKILTLMFIKKYRDYIHFIQPFKLFRL